jgi:hypothetical protein
MTSMLGMGVWRNAEQTEARRDDAMDSTTCAKIAEAQ